MRSSDLIINFLSSPALFTIRSPRIWTLQSGAAPCPDPDSFLYYTCIATLSLHKLWGKRLTAAGVYSSDRLKTPRNSFVRVIVTAKHLFFPPVELGGKLNSFGNCTL